MPVPSTMVAFFLASGLIARPPREDEAHRLDRIQTQLLNRRAAARLDHPTDQVPPVTGGPDLRQREQRALEQWRAENERGQRRARTARQLPGRGRP